MKLRSFAWSNQQDVDLRPKAHDCAFSTDRQSKKQIAANQGDHPQQSELISGSLSNFPKTGSFPQTGYCRFFYSRLTGLVVNSQETARLVLASGRLIPPERVRVIPNGLDPAWLDGAPRARSWRRPPGMRGERR